MDKAKTTISGLKTVGAFINQRACSDTLFHVLNNCAFASPLKTEEKAAMHLAGGLMQNGYQCGMIWGAALAAGAQAYRLAGKGARAEAGAILAAERLVASFRGLNQHVNCAEITGTTKASTALELTTYFLLKGGSLSCFRMAAQYAPVAFSNINAALAEETELPAGPVSCAALVAQRLGASELHTVMVAGLAGGIGLTGGGCGALGAAIWLKGMQQLRDGGKVTYANREGEAIIGRFVKSTGGEWECARIADRRFNSVADHAAYLRMGGCAMLIETLGAC